ncbi:MAG: rex [Firmicutes bacterium]|nr:rex [Bacillota bacterium]
MPIDDKCIQYFYSKILEGDLRVKEQIVISKATIDRLPLYFRTLRLAGEEGIDIISSEELGKRLGITPEQIRKDLASFGQFGKKGVGYYVAELKRNVGEILGLDNNWNIAVIGIGHLGVALSNYQNFTSLGFKLVALFDKNPEIIGKTVSGAKVEDIEELERIIKERNVHIGIIAVPRTFAQGVADKLVAAGVKGIWNFAPIKIKVPDSMHIVNEDLSVGLSSLSYHITRK